MFSKHRIRFSIGAMLVLMAGVAVLVNREVQRAKAIETTVKKIEEWHGQVDFRPRAKIPGFLATILPEYWSTEIDWIDVRLYSKEWPEPYVYEDEFAVIDPSEFDRLLELGALDGMGGAILNGTAVSHAAVLRVCKSPTMVGCFFMDSSLSESEINELEKSYPESDVMGSQHKEIEMKARKDR